MAFENTNMLNIGYSLLLPDRQKDCYFFLKYELLW